MTRRFLTGLISAIALVSVLGLTGCPTPDNGSTDNGVNKKALTEAITAASAVNAAAEVGVAEGNVSQEAKNTFTAAIGAAETVANDANASQSTVDSAVTTLNAATTSFNNSKVLPLVVSKTALAAAIAEAVAFNEAHAAGTELGNVSEADKTVFAAAVAAAQAVAADTAATQAAVDAAVITLASARSAFEIAIIAPAGDNAALLAALTAATALRDGATEGVAVGNVAVGSKAAFTAVIEAAQAVASNSQSNQAAINASVASLAAATDAFNAAIIVKGNTVALAAAISAAATLNAAHTVGTGNGYVTQAAKDSYTAAIAAATAVSNDANAVQATVDAAVVTLASATTVFSNAIIVVTKADLASAIAAANTLNAAHAVGTSYGQVSQGAKDTYDAAIAAAQAVASDAQAAQTAVDGAVATLAAATTTFASAFNTNLVTNGDFSVDKIGGTWAPFPATDTYDVNYYTSTGTIGSILAGKLNFDVTNVGGSQWDTQVGKAVLFGGPEGVHRVSFTASSTVARDIFFKIDSIEQMNLAAGDAADRIFSLTATPKVFSFTITTSGHAATPRLRLLWALGALNGSTASVVTFDDFIVRALTAAEIPPVVTLNGASTVNLFVGDAYTELDATVTDNLDAGLSAVITGSVNTAVAGTYILTYTATDSNGNTDQKTRTVIVTEVPAGPKYVYLTSGTPNLACTLANWDLGANVNDYALDAAYTPVIQANTLPDGWSGGTPAAAAGFNNLPAGALVGYANVVFKIKTTMTSMFVKLEGTGAKEISFAVADGTALADGWVQMTIPFASFTGYDVSTSNKLGVHTGWGAAGVAFLITDVGFTLP